MFRLTFGAFGSSAALALLLLGAPFAAAQDAGRRYFYEDIFTPFFAKDEASGLYRAQRPGSQPAGPAVRDPAKPLPPQTFSIRKSTDAFRVFVLGGSIALNYMAATDHIGNELARILPSMRVEAINCGVAGYDSPREALILEEVLEYQPDLIVLLTGHNDGMNSPPVPLWLLHAQDRLSRIGAFRALVAALNPQDNSDQRGKARGRDARFAANVRDMLRHAAAKGVPLLAAIPPLNYRESPPEKPLYFYNAALAKGWISFLRGDDAAALASWQTALSAKRPDDDTERAHILFMMAAALDRSGRLVEAGRFYRRSVEADWTAGRCRPSCQETLRSLAGKENGLTADLDALFRAKTAPALPGLDMFSDHVHWLRENDKAVSLGIVRALRGDARFRSLPWNEPALKDLERRWAVQKHAPNEEEAVGTLRYAVTRAGRTDKSLSWAAVAYLGGVRRSFPAWVSDAASVAARADAGSRLFVGKIWGQPPVKTQLAPLEWHLGELRLRSGDQAQALPYFASALAADPAMSRVLLSRAFAQLLSADAQGAQDSLEQARASGVMDAYNLGLAMGFQMK